MKIESTKAIIEELALKTDAELKKEGRALGIFLEFKTLLNNGEIRAAEKRNGHWEANAWVKRGILLGMRLGALVETHVDLGPLGKLPFVDKDTYPVKKFCKEDKVRIVPGGSSVRDGAYLAPGVVMMPPAYVNVGAYVDVGSMIDSHALVGSCAQVGRNVHLSAAVQVGGVLEPIGAVPVIIEDDVMVGGNCGIYDGTIVQERAVIGTGVILNKSIPVFDLVNKREIRATADEPLIIPSGAVVIPGTRKLQNMYARELGLSAYCAIIPKYRDDKTDNATELESALR